MREPSRDCDLCPRLVAFREKNRKAFPDWHNAPVVCFGDPKPRMLIVGLAPGLKGANRTSRPFTGDYAGDLLYGSLLKFGFAKGTYGATPDDGLKLVDCRITNAVRCVPPQNKPVGAEINTCIRFLEAEIAALPRLEMILALGRIAHEATLKVLGARRSAFPFRHGAIHEVRPGLRLADSYHCSRYNTNTGRLTEAMFHGLLAEVKRLTRVRARPAPSGGGGGR
jgi:uracil-DNA glycosylase family 4